MPIRPLRLLQTLEFMRRLRIAVVGLGAVGREHARAIRRIADLELVGGVDPSDGGAAFCSDLGITHFRRIEDVLELAELDGVVVATPNDLHVTQTRLCISRGLAVLLEKPISHSLQEARELVRDIEQSNALVLIGHHRAHSAIMRKACELIDTGFLGDLVCIAGSATFCKPDSYFAQAPWRALPGAGPILINMVHEVHSLRMLCGEIVEVQALASRQHRRLQVEESACVNMRFSNGALGSFLLSDVAASSRSWEQTSGENSAYARDPNEDCYCLTGRKGTLLIPTLRSKVFPPEARSWFTPLVEAQHAAGINDPLQQQMAHFAKVIRGEENPLVTARDGMVNLSVVEAISKAAKSGNTVKLQ